MSNFDVLIPSHGESVHQIEFLLYSILMQRTPNMKLGTIHLCSDNEATIERFSDYASINFIKQEPKKGKPDAFNRMLKEAGSELCIQNSADCVPASDYTYHYLLASLNKFDVGAVTGKPIPVNQGFFGLPNIVWKCHEFIQPKLSAELFSFKKSLVPPLPLDIIHDDAYIHNMIEARGYYVDYEPRALVFNSVPVTFREFYLQRKKNVVGNIQLWKQFYMSTPKMMRIRSLILMSLELLANVHGRLDYVRGKIPKGLVGYNLETTKEVRT